MSDKFRLSIMAVLVLILSGSFAAAYTGVDKESWKVVAPTTTGGLIGLLQNKKDDNPST